MASPFEIRSDGATIRGESAGFGMPVVFLHAAVADRRMWAGQMELLAAAGYHVVSYDRRGFGETESPDEPFSHLNDLEIVLDRLGIHAAILVGASMGGALAIDFAIEFPNRTVGLVLVGTSVSGEEPPADFPEEVLALFDAAEYARERGNWSSLSRIYAHLWLDGPLEPSGRVEGPVRDLFLDMCRTMLEKPGLTQEDQPDPAVDSLGTLTAPTLLVVGELDFPNIIDTHSDISDEMENAFAVVLEGTAHLPSLERPDLFDQLLMEFLEALAGEVDDDEEDEDEEDGRD